MPADSGNTLLAHWKWLVLGVSIIFGAVSTAFGFGIARAKIAMKSELYNPDGSQIYVPKSEFDKIADKVEAMNYTLGQINQFMKERIK